MTSATSPMMIQWQTCKQQAGSALLLFRLGDFYEAFENDAVLLSKALNVTLTARQGTPMAGIPAHSSEGYIDKLVAKGYRVAIAEQVEDPKAVKGLVKREVVRTVSAGTLINSALLIDNAHNFLSCITQVGKQYGLAILDLTTAEFKTFECDSIALLVDEFVRIQPKELLLSKRFADSHPEWIQEIERQCHPLMEIQEELRFDYDYASRQLCTHFKVHNLDGFGLADKRAATCTAGALLSHIDEALHLPINHIQGLTTHHPHHYMQLDRSTQRHLELIQQQGPTLLSTLDETKTAMGGRLLKQWLTHPLLNLQEIHNRQQAIHTLFSLSFQPILSTIQDLDRLMMRIETGCASPRDLGALRQSLEGIAPLKTHLTSLSSPLLVQIRQDLLDVSTPLHLLQLALVDAPPLLLREGGIFKKGYSQELDTLKDLQRDSQAWVANYQTRLREETGIKTLKVGYTSAFGYYIEVSRGAAEKMPSSFERKQTLTNAERFVTPELKEFEYQVLNAEEKMTALESSLFFALRQTISTFSQEIHSCSRAIAQLDCLCSLSLVAKQRNYVCPVVDDSGILEIKRGRHPVVETVLNDAYIPNDVTLDPHHERLHLITGPNMAGKSTFIRQIALITIMAQIGSFVPAQSAHIGLVDKVFTRIGASDDLSRGQSTFMVEMTETANILRHATSRSLVILDEIGRGTSTYDGISIAWAVAEYLLTQEGKQAKTLFATHYWELTALEQLIEGASNYHVAVHEGKEGIIFLRKIVKGSTDKSYGIHVAKLAGLPPLVIQKAQERLLSLAQTTPAPLPSPSLTPHPLEQALSELDVNSLSPLQALQRLFEWKSLYKS